MGGELAPRAQLGSPAGPPDLAGGDIILWVVFLAGLGSGLVAVGLIWLCVRPSSSGEAHRAPPALTRWKRVAERALAFLRKRRAISLAFGNYKNKPLKRAAPAKRLRRRIASPGTGSTLREGPVVRHGS